MTLNSEFFQTMLDNLMDGVYVLDNKGNYVFVNTAYVQLLNMPKTTLLKYNVHDFLNTGQIEICISDRVYEEKRQIVMFQDVYDTQNYGRNKIRQLVISTPIFNDKGDVENILAVVRPMDKANELYRLADVNMNQNEGDVPAIHTIQDDQEIIAESQQMLNVIFLAETVAKVDSTVLLTGASGTGKEVIAKHIYKSSERRSKPYIVINCASLPENLLEAELFGYEKGAFTGASAAGKKGLFEEAAGGTLFLDEINSLPLNLQGKVLRAIENKTIQRIGSNKTISVDFRLIAATNVNLSKMVADGLFRTDLYYRLNVVPIRIPSISERKDDIIPLAIHFLNHFCNKYDKDKVFTEETLKRFQLYSWPGNVREIKNVIERAVVTSMGHLIEITDVETFAEDPLVLFEEDEIESDGRHDGEAADYSAYNSLQEYLDKCESEFIRYAFEKYGSTYKVAEALGISQTSAVRRRRKYDETKQVNNDL